MHLDWSAGMTLLTLLQINANLVLFVYFSITKSMKKRQTLKSTMRVKEKQRRGEEKNSSIPRRKANCASFVIASASSSKTNFTCAFALPIFEL